MQYPFKRLIRRVYRSIIPEPIPPCDVETQCVLRRVLRPDSHTADVGCNRGSILQEIVRLAPHGQHFAFEPIPVLHHRLRRRFPGVNCYQLALSDTTTVAYFNYFTRLDGFSGLVRRQLDIDPGPVKELSVQTERLDMVVPKEIKLTLIKIDVEGAEYRVLRGAQAVLRRSQPVVVFECGKGGLDLYGHAPEQVYELLTEYGLGIRLLADWNPDTATMSRQQFVDTFYEGTQYMFVASPD